MVVLWEQHYIRTTVAITVSDMLLLKSDQHLTSIFILYSYRDCTVCTIKFYTMEQIKNAYSSTDTET